MADPTFTRISDAVNKFRSGNATARSDLLDVWFEIGPTGDAFHRCTLAHYLADMYEDAAESLIWTPAHSTPPTHSPASQGFTPPCT